MRSKQPESNGKLILPKSYAESVEMFEKMKGEMGDEVHQYYKGLFTHELREFEEHYSKWESERIY